MSIFVKSFLAIAKIKKLEALVKEYAVELNKRVPVEQRLLDSANGSKPLPTKEDCLKMAQTLGRTPK